MDSAERNIVFRLSEINVALHLGKIAVKLNEN